LEGNEAYQLKLENYLQNVKDPELENLARKMLIALTGEKKPEKPVEEDKTLADKDTITIDSLANVEEAPKEAIIYKENMGQTHIFILALDPADLQEAKNLTSDLENFHTANYANARLRTGTISISKENTLVIISPFSNAEKALEYRKKFLTEFNTDGLNAGLKNSSFAISIENFQQLNKRKDLDEYKAFYKEAYK